MVLAQALTPSQPVTSSSPVGLGPRLKALRLRARLSQQTVTIQVLGEPSKFWLSNIETGRATLPHNVAPRLASTLGVSIESLLGLDGSFVDIAAVKYKNLRYSLNTPEEDAYIVKQYRRRSLRKIAKALGRNWHSVQSRCQRLIKLGLLDPHTRHVHRPWTSADDDLLREKWGLVTDAYLARKLKRTRYACIIRAKKLGINRKQWFFTQTEVARLFGVDDHKVRAWIRDGHLVARGAPFKIGPHRCWMITAKDLETFFKFHHDKYDPTRINRDEFPYWRNLGDEWGDPNFARHLPQPYSLEEDAFIIRNFATMAIRELADKLQRTESSVRKRIAILRRQGRLPSEPKSQVRYLHRYPKWTQEQDDFLRENFRILPDADVAFVVERTIAACEQRARKLGIERPVTNIPNNPIPLSLPQAPQLNSTTTMPTGTARLELIEGTGGIGGTGGGGVATVTVPRAKRQHRCLLISRVNSYR